MKKRKAITNYNYILLLIAVITVFIGLRILESVNVSKDENRIIEIKTGMATTEIAGELYKKGIILSADYFRIISKFYGYSGRFKAGKHKIENCRNLKQLAEKLTQNPEIPPDIKVTIIEGLNLYETASVYKEKANIDSVKFIKLAKDPLFLKKLGIDNSSLEGYLYPDTYFVIEKDEPADIIKKMVKRFNEVVTDSIKAKALDMGMNLNEMLTLASIISTEAAQEEEMKIVSSVFHKRLKLKMPLGANATVQYAIGEKRRLNNNDLKIVSPYNTYTNAGLPPGPIASPGMNAINATINPASTQYLYFVADGKGGHVFSKNIDQHTKAVREYIKTRNNL